VSTKKSFLPLIETVTPDDQTAASDAIRQAYESDTPVYPLGGLTNIRIGGTAKRPGIGLSTANLDRLIDHAARDLTITVEAGMTVAKLAKHLTHERQRLPIDVPSPESATVGGVVSANICGPRRYQYGTIKDYVIGVSAVNGLGQTLSGGGRVVKNAAGYDMCRLLTGSLGSLGLITQVTLMVRPLPEASAMVVGNFPDYETAEKLLRELGHSSAFPTAIEWLSGPAWDNNPILGKCPSSSVGRLVIGFEGPRAEVDWMVEQLEGQWRLAPDVAAKTVPEAEVGSMWNCLTDCVDQTLLNVKISTLPSRTVEIVESIRTDNPDCSIQSHAGNGITRVQMATDPDDITDILNQKLRPVVSSVSGHLSVISVPNGVDLSASDAWGAIGGGATVMQAIKDRFDPKRLLNPDRFVYGI